MGSTRLPGKSLLPLAGEPMLWRILERLRRCTRPEALVVATTTKAEDDVLVAIGERAGVDVFRGSEGDLIERHLQAAAAFHADVIVRFPADNPVPEPGVIDSTVDNHIASGNDYTSTFQEGFDNGFPDGIGAEVYEVAALVRAAGMTSAPEHREHPHRFLLQNPGIFKLGTMPCPAEYRRPDLILDVNTREQYEFMANLYGDLYPRNPKFGILDVIAWYDSVYLAS
jgi:spore coat polysaccharide biosynthesis protein SpsF